MKLLNITFVILLIITNVCHADTDKQPKRLKNPLIDRPTHPTGRYYRMPKLDVKGLSEQQKSEKYINQLVSDNQPYATVRGYPFLSPEAFFDRFANADPISIIKVDDTFVKVIPSNFNRSLTHYTVITSSLRLKIPAGEHTLVITGADYGNSALYAQTPKITLEAGKHYIAKPSKIPNDTATYIQVFEYKPDERFMPSDADSIILGKAITPVLKMDYTPKF